MKQNKFRKYADLTRRGISFLLALILVLSAYGPGAAYATGETEPAATGPALCQHCNVELTEGAVHSVACPTNCKCAVAPAEGQPHEADCPLNLQSRTETTSETTGTTGNTTGTIEGCTNHEPVCPGDNTCTIEGCTNHEPVCPGDNTCTIEGCTNHEPVCPGDNTCTIEGCTNHEPVCPGDNTCTIEGCTNHEPVCPGDNTCTIEGCTNHTADVICGNCGERHDGACTIESVKSTQMLFSSVTRAAAAEVKSPTFTKTAELREDGNYDLKLTISGAFAQESSPAKVDIVLIIDRSGSMVDNTVTINGKTTTRFANAISAAQSLVNAVSSNGNLSPRYKIITFEGRIFEEDGYKAISPYVTASGWKTTKDAALSTINGIPTPVSGAATNYEAAFVELGKVSGYRTGASKIVIFLTDGDPTIRVTNEDNTANKREGKNYHAEADHYFGSGMTNAKNVAACLATAKTEIAKVSMDRFYAVGTGNVTSTNLTELGAAATKASYVQVKATSDSNLTKIFNDIAKEITNFYCSNVTVTDILKHVDNQLVVDLVNTDDVYVTVYDSGKIKAGPTKGAVTLNITDDYEGDTITASYDKASGTLKLDFPDDYNLEKTYTYEISTVIKPTEKAYREYRKNMDYPKDKEGKYICGDKDTGTHTGQAGFHANDEAIATYYYMGEKTDVAYAYPVVKLDPGTLIVNKSFVGLTADRISAISDLNFKVTLTYPDDGNGIDDETEVKTINFKDMKDDDGDGVYSYSIGGLSPNTQYSVTEEGGKVNGFDPVVASQNTTGSVPKGGTETASFTNTYTTSLTVGKTVTGNMGDWSLPFSFTVTIGDRTETFSLKHGESIQLTDIPIGANVTVAETTAGYTATATLNDKNCTVTDGVVTFKVEDIDPDTVWFTNDKTATIDTGVVLDSMPYIIILAGVAAAAAFLFLRRRNRYED